MCHQAGDGHSYWGPLALLAQPRITAYGTFSSFQVFLENVQHEDAFVYLSAIQGEQYLLERVPALCQGRFCAVGLLGPGSEDQESHSQAEGLASPALPDCGFVLFHQAWGHMWAPCRVPEAGDFISQLFLLPGACHHPCARSVPQAGAAVPSTAWAQPQHPSLAPTEGSVQLRLTEEQEQGDPVVVPQGSAKVATPEYSRPFLGNPQVSACSSTLSTAPQHRAVCGICRQAFLHWVTDMSCVTVDGDSHWVPWKGGAIPLSHINAGTAAVGLVTFGSSWERSLCCASQCLYGLERDGSVLARSWSTKAVTVPVINAPLQLLHVWQQGWG